MNQLSKGRLRIIVIIHVYSSHLLLHLQADLIHLGAKFAPCMHRDEQVFAKIEDAKFIENMTGCCIRSDNAGCVQTSSEECSVSS